MAATTDKSSDDNPAGINAKEQLHWRDQIKAKNYCVTHKQTCVVIPGTINEPGTHVKIQQSDLLLWSEHLVSLRASTNTKEY